MEYTLKNGKTVKIRKPTPNDAEALVSLITKADTETRFLAREPGEFDFTVEMEREYLETVIRSEDEEWFLAECDGKLVGQASARRVSSRRRFAHRGAVALMVLQEYCGMGIGGKLMQACIAWCTEAGLEQVELDVVSENTRALNMYKSFGFELTGTKPRALKYADGSYADEYIMVKFL